MNEPLTLCLNDDSILVSRAVLEALDCPRQIQMMINDEQRMLLLQPCTVESREAIVVRPDAEMQFEMSGHSLLKRVRRLTGWADSAPRVVFGNYISSHHAVVFDLSTAVPVGR